MSQVIKFVDVSGGNCEVEERFIDFFNTHEKTGEGLSYDILTKVQADGLNINDCRGQGYDNDSTMAGKYIGVQAQICRLNDQARYVFKSRVSNTC